MPYSDSTYQITLKSVLKKHELDETLLQLPGSPWVIVPLIRGMSLTIYSIQININ